MLALEYSLSLFLSHFLTSILTTTLPVLNDIFRFIICKFILLQVLPTKKGSWIKNYRFIRSFTIGQGSYLLQFYYFKLQIEEGKRQTPTR